MDYSSYFKKLEDLNSQNEENAENETCCENPEYIFDNTYETCKNCGNSLLKNIKNEYDSLVYNGLEKQRNYLNKKYMNSTIVGNCYKKKYNILKLIHNQQNYNYKEKTLMINICDIDKICEHLNLSKIIRNKSKLLYKNIYIDESISSRCKIKKAVYIFCVYKVCSEENIYFELEEILKFSGINLDNYTFCLKKMEKLLLIKNDKKYLEVIDLIKEKIEICRNLNLEIKVEDVKSYYNKYRSFVYKPRLNNKSILTGVLYILLKDQISQVHFIKIFKTTKITLNKFNRFKKKNIT